MRNDREFAARMMCRIVSGATAESNAIQLEITVEMVEAVMDELDKSEPCGNCGKEIHPEEIKREVSS